MKKNNFKEAFKKFIKQAYFYCIVGIFVCWFMKLFGINWFDINLNNQLFQDMSNFFDNHYWFKQMYFAILLNIQLYFMICIVQKQEKKPVWIYILKLLPVTIGLKVFTCIFEKELGFWAMLIEFVYLTIVMSKFKPKHLLKSVFMNIMIIVYQLISQITKSQEIQDIALNFVAGQILSIDLYLLLYLSKEVSLMNEGTWFFFGWTEWLYAISGFIVGIFTGHPILKYREYRAKGKAIENAREAEKELKTIRAK